MSEWDEVADTWRAEFMALYQRLSLPPTMQEARQFVRRRMPDESHQLIDNIAWSLLYGETPR